MGIIHMVNHMVMEYQRNIGSIWGIFLSYWYLKGTTTDPCLNLPLRSIHHAVHILEKYLGESFMKKAFNDPSTRCQ